MSGILGLVGLLVFLIILSFCINIIFSFYFCYRLDDRDRDEVFSSLNGLKKINGLFIILLLIMLISLFRFTWIFILSLIPLLIYYIIIYQYYRLCDFLFDYYFYPEMIPTGTTTKSTLIGGAVYIKENNEILVKIKPFKKIITISYFL